VSVERSHPPLKPPVSPALEASKNDEESVVVAEVLLRAAQ
jgi:hypothetical protein